MDNAYLKYNNEWFNLKTDMEHKSTVSETVASDLNKVMEDLTALKRVITFNDMPVNLTHVNKINEAIRLLGSVYNLPLDIPELAKGCHEYIVCMSVYGYFSQTYPVSEKGNSISEFNDALEDADFGALTEIEWDLSETTVTFAGGGKQYYSTPVTGYLYVKIFGENLTQEDIREKALTEFEDANFQELEDADIEEFRWYSCDTNWNEQKEFN